MLGWSDTEHLLEAVLSLSADAIFVKDPEGTIVLANGAAERVFGCRSGELIGRRESELVPAALARSVAEIDERVVAGEEIEHTVELGSGITRRIYRFTRRSIRDTAARGTRGILTIVPDITSEQRSSDDLALSDGRFRLAALSTSSVLYDYDIVSDSIWWSASLQAVLGYPDLGETTTLEWWSEHIHEDDRERVVGSLQAAIDGGAPFWSERYRMRCADDSWAHILDRGYFIGDSSGRSTRMIGALNDYSDAQNAYSALAVEQDRYRSLIENADEIIFDVDLEGRIRDINPAFERITGFELNEVLGRSFFDFLDESQHEKARRQMATNLSPGRRDQQQGLWPVKTKDGSTILLEATSTPQIVDGNVVGMFGIGRDVTERVRATEERERLSRYLQLLLSSTSEGIYGVDASGSCTFVNSAAQKILGYDEKELLGSEMHVLVHHSRGGRWAYPVDDCPVRKAYLSSEALTGEEVFWRKDGKPIPVEFSVSPLSDGGVNLGAVVVFSGTEQRKLMERQLEQAKRLSSLGRLAATVAHEFNNVLMSIQPSAEVILRLAGAEERIASLASNIEQAVRRGRRITHEILRYTQPAKPSLTAISLAEWLPPFLDELRKVLGSEFELTGRIADDSLAVDADPAQLHQVLTNLVLNARDAIGERGGVIEVTVSPAASRILALRDEKEHPAGEYVCISIRDSGPGIPAELLGEIFEPLFTTKGNGTGLGLAVVHQIVAEHGGQISATNSDAGGALFEMLLPRARAVGADVREVPAASTIGFENVLLVEDDPTVAAGMTALLEIEGSKVIHVATGAAAIPAIEGAEIHLVILDVGLPDLDGTVVYERIAGRWPHLPVIFSTGHSGRARLERYLQAPNVGFLQKPYDFPSLASVCSQLRVRMFV